MRCGMCEMHVEEIISKSFKVKKVKASRFKKQVTVFSEHIIDEENFKKVLDLTGYRLISYKKEIAHKTLLGWK